MKFCMLTTFFGTHSFGGDAAFVDRLSRTLARRGHEVHVVHCRDAFEISRGDQGPRHHEPAPGVVVHTLASPWGRLSPLATHQTGRPWFKTAALKRIIRAISPDVLHVHNLSLIGGPGLLELEVPGAVKLMTAHEHWLVCPLTVLWKLGREVCETPECVKCCLQSGRPPQLWRKTGLLDRSLHQLDALICPSRSTQLEHARRGLTRSTVRLPYFLPDDYPGRAVAATPRHVRPYVAAAGRLEAIKGFQDAIEAMRRLPEIDLRIAGSGAFESALREQAQGLRNVHFEGRLDTSQVSALFRGARAVVVPSLVYETFGYVVLEAFHEATPVIVRDRGALPELVEQSQGGLVFGDLDGLVSAIDRVVSDSRLRRRLGDAGRRARDEIWCEERHIQNYLELIRERRRSQRLRRDSGHGEWARPALDRGRARARSLASIPPG
ncbi:MAG: glycosyltransferase family 4 protein [Isosphaeraceae bacterium]